MPPRRYNTRSQASRTNPQPLTRRTNTNISNSRLRSGDSYVLTVSSSSDEETNANVSDVELYSLSSNSSISLENTDEDSVEMYMQQHNSVDVVDASVEIEAESIGMETEVVEMRVDVEAAYTEIRNSRSENEVNNENPARVEGEFVAEARLSPQASIADTSFDDFQKKKSTLKQTSPGNKNKSLNETSDDSEMCTICFEPWTSSGLHRLVSLRCGHLFGHHCIEKWLASQESGKCPQCNDKARKKDIRFIYARALRVVDTTERDRMTEELLKEKSLRQRAEWDLAVVRSQLEKKHAECMSYRDEVEKLKCESQRAGTSWGMTLSGSSQSQSSVSGRFVYEKTIKIESGGCRVLVYSSHFETLCISQSSPFPVYPGCGIKKLSVMDLKTSKFVHIHSKTIRDLSFHPKVEDSLLLSCSMDKTIKVTSLSSDQVVQTYNCTSPVWSCTWHGDNRNFFFAGTQSGLVNQYDIRNTSTHVSSLLSQPEQSKSVISLQYIPQISGNQLRPGGLLVGKLDTSMFFECSGVDFKPHHMNMDDGALTSLSVEFTTSHVLASFRPTNVASRVRHQLYSFAVTPSANDNSMTMLPTLNKQHTFYGGSTQKFLSKSMIMLHPDRGSEQLFVCAGDESTKTLNIWDTSAGDQFQKLGPLSDDVLDLCTINYEGRLPILSALTEKELFVYQWRR